MGLTKEEKKAKKEAKKLAKVLEEIEAKRKAKRHELQREISAQNVRRGVLDKSWKEMMLKIKEPVFRQDIEVMWHVFERAYDKKDHLINYNLHLCDVAEEQTQRSVFSFCDKIDALINKFLADLENMTKDNERSAGEVQKYNEDINKQIMTDNNTAETYLQLLLFHGHKTSDNSLWTRRGENLVREDEDRTKFGNERDLMRSTLENHYNDMWENYKNILKAYVVSTADNQKQARRLRRKENKMADIIAAQDKKITNGVEQIKRLRSELAAYESGSKQAAFRERRERHRDACLRLKKKLCASVATDVSRLETLIQSSGDAVKWMDAAYQKCEKIMRMAALCRRFETRHEKIMPYGSYIPQTSYEMKIAARRDSFNNCLTNDAVLSTCGLTRFWQRVSKVELTKRALLREKMLLIQENADIECKIQEQKEKKQTLTICECIKQSPDNKKATVSKPVAIEGALEIRKMK